ERYQQTLYLLEKVNGKMKRTSLRPTLFVPMTGTAEDSRQRLPDGSNPRVINGDFREAGYRPVEKNPDDKKETSPTQTGNNTDAEEFIAGWYYGRQFRRVDPSKLTSQQWEKEPWENQPSTLSSGAFVRFENETPGLSAHLLQGLALDGRQVTRFRMSASLRIHDVVSGPDATDLPALAVSLYDKDRRELGIHVIGPFRGTRDWRSISQLVRVPPQTREVIVRIGLFGGTGTADFDNIELTPM
ncbi:MAG: protein-L-isoaspartate(D-aspartate) O-methyltransferase, partial [Planctomycetota bacterium]